jgi:hypothetical protein
MEEHLATLRHCSNTSPDPDDIQNKMLSHHPLAGKNFLLSTHNHVLMKSVVQMPGKKLSSSLF